jgi:serine/threonine protein kinase
MLGQLPDQPRLLVQRGIYYEQIDRWFTSTDNKDDERHGYLPVQRELSCLCSLLPDLPSVSCYRACPLGSKLFFYQILEGADALHNARPSPLVHQDLKPANIGVVSYLDQSIAIVILDYGQAIQVQPHNSIRGKAGTPGYQAQDMQHQVYNTSLDIWSCGIIGLRMFVSEWQHSSNVRMYFQEGVAMLGADDKYTPRNLLSQMLAWEPNERISASQALLHPCFSPLLEVSTYSTLLARKRHRKEDKGCY